MHMIKIVFVYAFYIALQTTNATNAPVAVLSLLACGCGTTNQQRLCAIVTVIVGAQVILLMIYQIGTVHEHHDLEDCKVQLPTPNGTTIEVVVAESTHGWFGLDASDANRSFIKIIRPQIMYLMISTLYFVVSMYIKRHR